MQTSYGTNGRIFTALNLVRYENLDIFEEYLETLNFDDNQLKFIKDMRHTINSISNDVSSTIEKLKTLMNINNNYRYELYLSSCEITGDNSEIQFDLPYEEKMANYTFNDDQTRFVNVIRAAVSELDKMLEFYEIKVARVAADSVVKRSQLGYPNLN